VSCPLTFCVPKIIRARMGTDEDKILNDCKWVENSHIARMISKGRVCSLVPRKIKAMLVRKTQYTTAPVE